MFDKLRGLPPDPSMLDIISSSLFSTVPNHNIQDPQSILYSTPKNLAMMSQNSSHSDLVMKPQSQDLNNPYLNPNMLLQQMMGSSLNQKQLMLDLHLDKAVSDEIRIMSEDVTYSDSSSNDEKGKRGKYKTYTEDEKTKIVNYMMKHGMDKTLEAFSGETHKLTKRKLKGWLEGVDKVKGVKGRKSNDPGRDEALHTWCADFQKENGRPPSRKEATKKALELNADPSFMASKGWLDKFSRKYGIEFTPLKILPPRGNKKVKTETNSKMSCVSETAADSRNISPLFPATGALEAKAGEHKMTLDDRAQGSKSSLLLNLKRAGSQQPEQVQQTSQNSHISPRRHEGKVGAVANSPYQTMNASNLACPVTFNMMEYANGPSFDLQALSYLNNLYNPYSMQYQASLINNYQAGLQELQKMMIRQKQENVNFDRV